MLEGGKVLKYRFSQIIVLSGVVICLTGCSKSDDDIALLPDKLSDTGITWSADYPRGVNDDCSTAIDREQSPEGDILPQQDCTRGRDVTANDSHDGAAGFVYRKISDDGKALGAGVKDWDCVLDEITGLLWEVKRPTDNVYGNQGQHDGDDLYTWYNANSRINGGAIGDWNSQYNQCVGYVAGQPATYCNIEEYVGRVNRKGLCGFRDWRVPTLPELATLVNFGRISPAIDVAYFPNTRDEFYWSNSPDANLETTAWAVNFQLGYSAPMPRNNSHYVRLVRDWNPKLK